MLCRIPLLLTTFGLLMLPFRIRAQPARQVLVVVNRFSDDSRSLGYYYAQKRNIPPRNICQIRVTVEETIDRATYDLKIARPIGTFLKTRGLTEQIVYMVTTLGVPLRIRGTGGPSGDQAAVDSELALLYQDLKGEPHPVGGPLRNPFFGRTGGPFDHKRFPIYLVTRLAAYDLDQAKSLVDRSLGVPNRGKVALDLKAGGSADEGDRWLRMASLLLPRERVVLEETGKVLDGQGDLVGYASWGSNDPNRRERRLKLGFLPGALVTEYVSTNGRTLARPPDTWNYGSWKDPKSWFAGSPQSLALDYIEAGASGVSAHVYEPYLQLTPRPDLLFPAYFQGRNLAESYYLSIPALSWQNVIIGDPLCRLGD